MARQAAGQTITQSPQPVAQVSSSTGKDSVTPFSPPFSLPLGRRRSPASAARLRWQEDVGRAEIPRQPSPLRLLAVDYHHGRRVRIQPRRPFQQGQFAFQVAAGFDDEHRWPTLNQMRKTGFRLPRLAQCPSAFFSQGASCSLSGRPFRTRRFAVGAWRFTPCRFRPTGWFRSRSVRAISIRRHIRGRGIDRRSAARVFLPPARADRQFHQSALSFFQ